MERHLALMLVSCPCLSYQDVIGLDSLPDFLFFLAPSKEAAGP